MARIRTIKPEFFTSEDIVCLTPMARLLYIALWCEADREGRLAWKPRTFKMRYFPADAVDIDALCAEIVQAGLVNLYGQGYAHIPGFEKHQHINPRESASTLPDPENPCDSDASARVSDTQGGRKGKEGINDASDDASDGAPVGFAKFWDVWPKSERKVGRKPCLDKWKRKNLEAKADEIIAHVTAMRQTKKWLDGYDPSPQTYLNQELWRDGVPTLTAIPGGRADIFAGAL
jgi:hypothetical protein